LILNLLFEEKKKKKKKTWLGWVRDRTQTKRVYRLVKQGCKGSSVNSPSNCKGGGGISGGVVFQSLWGLYLSGKIRLKKILDSTNKGGWDKKNGDTIVGEYC